MIVLKTGGRALYVNFEAIMSDVVDLAKSGEKIILVHGGGAEIDEYAKRMNVETKYVVSASGIRSRLTDEDELELVMMVLAGLLNKKIVHRLLVRGVEAIGLTGLDAKIAFGSKRDKIIIIDERGRKRAIDAGYTGKIAGVNAVVLKKLLELFQVIVLSPIIYSDVSPLNTDADYFASRIACEAKSDGLIYLTDVDGVIIEGKLLNRIKADEARAVLQKIGTGMNRKVLHAVEAYLCGVRRVIISSGLTNTPVKNALGGMGSVISDEW